MVWCGLVWLGLGTALLHAKSLQTIDAATVITFYINYTVYTVSKTNYLPLYFVQYVVEHCSFIYIKFGRKLYNAHKTQQIYDDILCPLPPFQNGVLIIVCAHAH